MLRASFLNQRSMNATACLALLTALTGCPSEVPETWTKEGPVADGFTCNPLAPEWDCLMPYPSDFFRRKVTGGRRTHTLELPDGSKPKYTPVGLSEPEGFDFFGSQPADGFSVAPQVAIRVPQGVSTANLVFHQPDAAFGSGNIGDTLDATKSPTLLIDATTGELQPHFAELDLRPEDVGDQSLMLRPAKRLQNGRRYVVVLKGLKDATGAVLAKPSGYAKLVSGDTGGDAKLDRIRRYFEAHVFPVLQRANLDPAEVTLAWDFTTQSWEDVAGDVLAVRKMAMDVLSATPPAIEVLEVETPDANDGDYPYIGRRIRAKLRVPLFTVLGVPDVNGQPAGPNDFPDSQGGSKLFRDADGNPAQNGFAQAVFTIVVPRSVFDDPTKRPARLLQYGHGFFGGHGELLGYATRFANDTGMVIMGTDWTGMATEDAASILGKLTTDIPETMTFTERTVQGMVHFIALGYAAKTTLAALPELQFDGAPPYDPAAPLNYYGISQGHILGTTFVALSPHVERAAFSVGGGSFGFMMSRASPFGQFLGPIDETVGGPQGANSTRVVLLLQTSMDRIDPITWTPYLTKDIFEGGPASRKVLMQVGIGDDQVPNLASHLQARSFGVPLLSPAPREPWGLVPTAGPLDSALTEWDFGIAPPDVYARLNTNGNIVHEGVRRAPAAMAQIDAFLRPDGSITQTCRDTNGQPAACRCTKDANDTCGTRPE